MDIVSIHSVAVFGVFSPYRRRALDEKNDRSRAAPQRRRRCNVKFCELYQWRKKTLARQKRYLSCVHTMERGILGYSGYLPASYRPFANLLEAQATDWERVLGDFNEIGTPAREAIRAVEKVYHYVETNICIIYYVEATSDAAIVVFCDFTIGVEPLMRGDEARVLEARYAAIQNHIGRQALPGGN